MTHSYITTQTHTNRIPMWLSLGEPEIIQPNVSPSWLLSLISSYQASTSSREHEHEDRYSADTCEHNTRVKDRDVLQPVAWNHCCTAHINGKRYLRFCQKRYHIHEANDSVAKSWRASERCSSESADGKVTSKSTWSWPLRRSEC